MLLNDKTINNKLEKIIKIAAEENIESFVLGFPRPGDPHMVIWRFQNIKRGALILMLKGGIEQAVEDMFRQSGTLNEEKEIFNEMLQGIQVAIITAGNKMRTLKAGLEIKKRK